MQLEPWNPWKELEEARREADRLFHSALERVRDALSGEVPSFVPATDVVEGDNEYRIYIALPGVLEEDIDIACEGKILTVRGERECPYDTGHVHLRQWEYGYFERRIQLPRELERDAIQATLESGVLTLRIQKKS